MAAPPVTMMITKQNRYLGGKEAAGDFTDIQTTIDAVSLDEANATAHEVSGSGSRGTTLVNLTPPLVSPFREPTPERDPTPEPASPPTPPAQTFMFEEPLVFGPTLDHWDVVTMMS
ncbi:hypothetical protein Tco_0059072 [Tanacetum coccineum]